MALFDGEKFAKSLMRGLGVDPAQVDAIMHGLTEKAERWDREITAFKPAAGGAYQDVVERLTRIEEGQRLLMAALAELLDDRAARPDAAGLDASPLHVEHPPAEPLSNGVNGHE